LPVADLAPAPDPEDWYANLLWFDRRKCLLLTHLATLFTIFEADVTASSLRATRQLIAGLIGRELRREELPTGTFGDLEGQDVLLAKTADRSVLGCMNDMAYMCEHAIAGAGGLARTDLAELNRSLRRNINSARGHHPPIELTARRLTARKGCGLTGEPGMSWALGHHHPGKIIGPASGDQQDSAGPGDVRPRRGIVGASRK
jgi:hypothetical protein